MEPTAIHPQRIASRATDDAFETQVTHCEDVIALTTDQNIGAAVTNENIVPKSAVHYIGCGGASESVTGGCSLVSDGGTEVSTKDEIALPRFDL